VVGDAVTGLEGRMNARFDAARVDGLQEQVRMLEARLGE
jgi:hypothetical protein